MGDVIEWVSVKDRLPPMFVSVLGYMPNAGPFPAVRECFLVGEGAFWFPALNGFDYVTSWAEMPSGPKTSRLKEEQ